MILAAHGCRRRHDRENPSSCVRRDRAVDAGGRPVEDAASRENSRILPGPWRGRTSGAPVRQAVLPGLALPWAALGASQARRWRHTGERLPGRRPGPAWRPKEMPSINLRRPAVGTRRCTDATVLRYQVPTAMVVRRPRFWPLRFCRCGCSLPAGRRVSLRHRPSEPPAPAPNPMTIRAGFAADRAGLDWQRNPAGRPIELVTRMPHPHIPAGDPRDSSPHMEQQKRGPRCRTRPRQARHACGVSIHPTDG